MNYVEVPGEPVMYALPSVYLCGSKIEFGDDWRQQVADLLDDLHEGTLFNPQRSLFSSAVVTLTDQVRWEFIHRWNSTILAFWFATNDQSDGIYELGEQLVRLRLAKAKQPKICVGFDDGVCPYGIGLDDGVRMLDRRNSLKANMVFLAPDVKVVSKIEDLAAFIRTEVNAVIEAIEKCPKCSGDIFNPKNPEHAAHSKVIEEFGPAQGYSGFSGYCGCKRNDGQEKREKPDPATPNT